MILRRNVDNKFSYILKQSNYNLFSLCTLICIKKYFDAYKLYFNYNFV